MLPFTSLLLASTLCAEPTPAPVEVADLVEPARPGFDLSANLAAASADDVKPEEYGKWHGAVTFGATSASGNTDRFTAALGANAVNRREKDRRTFDLLWNYAEEEGTITQRRTYASGKYDYFVDKKLYYLGQASLENDMNAKLDLRAIAGAGAGYQFREDDIWKLAGEAGLSYVDENYDGSSDDAEFIAARLAYKADWTPNKAWAVGQATELYPSLEDNDDITARVDTHAKLTLTEKMFAQLQWIYSWDNTPATGAERVDNLFLLMIGWTF